MSESYFSPLWYRLSELRPRLKPHLDITVHDYRGETWFVVRDGVTGKIHRFTEQAYAIVGAMDGQVSLDAIWTSATARFGAQAPSQDEVVQLVSQLYQADLLSVDGVPDTGELLERMQRQRGQKRKRLFYNPLSITVPLLDPDRLLTALAPLVRGRMGWFWALAWCALVLSALPMLPAFGAALFSVTMREVLAMQNLALIALVYPIVKLIHELAHGLAVKRHDGAVHEMGVMLLVFYPVPYVDASQSAFFASKYARAMVGAAGIFAELGLAAAALHLWIALEPGTLRDIMFNVMLIGGFSTLAVNGNPLLRFDGYYVLCDLIEMPNLGSRANDYWGHLVKRLVLSVEEPGRRDPALFERIVMFIYAPLAFLYRLVVTLGIAAAVASQYFVVGVVLGAWSLFNGLILPVLKTISKMFSDPRLAERQGRATLMATSTTAVLVAGLLLVPLPLQETVQGVVWLPEAAQLRARTSGTIQALPVPPGQRAAAGAPVLVMEDAWLSTQRTIQRARLDEAEAIALAERARSEANFRMAREAVLEETERLDRLDERIAGLVVTASLGGIVSIPDDALLVGRYVHEGELIGHVLPGFGSQVRAAVPEYLADILQDRLAGASVRVSDSGRVLNAELLRVVPAAGNALPSPALGTAGGGPFAADPGDTEGLRTLDRLIVLDLSVPGLDAERFGQRVHVKLDFGWEPAGFRLYRGARQNLLALFGFV